MEIAEFKNKVVWITGSSSGIGEALVYAFDRQEAMVIISARRADELERVKNNCKHPENIAILPLDLAKHEELDEKTEKALAFFGRIDILVNNGGVSQRALAIETSIEVDKRIMDINYWGTVILTKAVLPKMIEQGGGNIVVTTSMLGKIATAYRSAYAASKHALHGFFDALRSEVYDKNIDILLVVPGYIHTNVSINALTADGSPQKTMDDGQKNGLPPEKLADEILKAIRRQKEEINVGGKEIIGIYLKRFFPLFFSKFIRKQKVT